MLHNVFLPMIITTQADWGRYTMSDLKERITNIVVELLGVDAEAGVETASFRDDLEADSLDLVELIMAFEQEFGAEIEDSEAQKVNTVGDAIKLIEKKLP